MNKKVLARLIIEYRKLSIVLCIALFLGLSQGLSKLTFNPDLETFFPKGHPATELKEDIDDTFLPTDSLIIAISGGKETIFKKETLNVIEKLTELSWTTPFSVRVDSLTNFSYVRSVDDDLLVEPFIENALLLSDQEIKKKSLIVEGEEAIYGSVISKDKRTSIINLVIDPPQPNKEANLEVTIDYVLEYLDKAKKENPQLDIRILGNPYQEYMDPKMLEAEIPPVMSLMFLVIFLSILFVLRSLAAVFSTFGVIILTIGSTFGSVGLLGNALNQMVITYPVLIITLALADCIHLFAIYFQERNRGETSKNSMIKSLELNLQPLFLTTVTTCIGFLSFNALDVEPLRDLGNGISIGVLFAFIYTIFFIAPLISFLNVKIPISTQQQVNLSRKIAIFSLSKKKTFLWIIPLSSLLLILLIPMNKLDMNPTQMYSEKYTSYGSDVLWLDKKLGATFPISFKAMSDNGSVSNPEFLESLDNFSMWLEKQNEVTHVTSLARTMKSLNKSMHGDDLEMKVIPEDQELSSQYLFFYEMSLPMGLDLNTSISQDRGSTRIAATLREMTSKEYLVFDKKVSTYLKDNNLESTISKPAGFRVIFVYLMEAVVNSLLIGVTIGMALIITVIGFFFRSAYFGFLSSFPNILPIVSAFGIWAIIDGQIDFMVAVGMGSTLGIIVDFTVHLLSKYDLARQELNKSPEDAVLYAFEAVGFALIAMTVILALGFSVLHLVSFLPMHNFAQFSILAFVFALIIDFFLFPNLLVRFDKRKFD